MKSPVSHTLIIIICSADFDWEETPIEETVLLNWMPLCYTGIHKEIYLPFTFFSPTASFPASK